MSEASPALPEPPSRARVPLPYEPSDEALAAYERLEEWLLDARGIPVTPQGGEMKLRNGKTEGEDIAPGLSAAEEADFHFDVEAALDCLHEVMLVSKTERC